MTVTNSHDRGGDAARRTITQRRVAMAVLSQAAAADIARGLSHIGGDISFTDARPAEIGLVMLRGRIGGGGAPFNVGEATVTRATVRLPSGQVGHCYALGRDKQKAKLAAIADALWQDPARRAEVETRLIAPLRSALTTAQEKRRAETAATKVDFFTMVRGED